MEEIHKAARTVEVAVESLAGLYLYPNLKHAKLRQARATLRLAHAMLEEVIEMDFQEQVEYERSMGEDM